MSSQAYVERLARALDSTDLLETVTKTVSDNQISVLCRVKPGMDARWIDLLKNILIAEQVNKSQAYAWKTHICRHYFLKNDNLVFGWNIAIYSNDIPTSLDSLTPVIRGGDPLANASSESGETMEMPLSGATDKRNQNNNGKGAYTVGGKNDFRPPVRR